MVCLIVKLFWLIVQDILDNRSISSKFCIFWAFYMHYLWIVYVVLHRPSAYQSSSPSRMRAGGLVLTAYWPYAFLHSLLDIWYWIIPLHLTSISIIKAYVLCASFTHFTVREDWTLTTHEEGPCPRDIYFPPRMKVTRPTDRGIDLLMADHDLGTKR